MTVEKVTTGQFRVSRSATVAAPSQELFEQLADPRRHHEVDGSGTVGASIKGPTRLALGDSFSVNMKMYGVPYKIKSKVTAFDDGKVIEWQHPLGHRWRWEFLAQSPTSTIVTETFDYGAAGSSRRSLYKLLGFPKQNAAGIEKTLTGLQARYPG